MISKLAFQRAMFAWFDQHGRKHLPWQVNKTPYRVWLSEIMLQQTQVATVIPYYQRFLQAFPDVYALAAAKSDAVMHLWAGLGYYSRARNLHAAAKYVVEAYQGKFPDSLMGLMTLPGVGRSTAGAILSIAYQQPTAILDGNVKRVLARFAAISAAITERKTEEALWALAEAYLPAKRSADYTQAMMDLGATICTRSKPKCSACPLHKWCQGYAQGIAAELPVKKKAKVLPVKEATFFIYRHQQQVLLKKNPEKGIWGGLWCLPQTPTLPDTTTLTKQFKSYQLLPAFKHSFTHYHLILHPVLIDVPKRMLKSVADESEVWYNLQHPPAMGLPKPIQTILRTML